VQGSTRALTNASGAIISGQTFDYSAFGDLISTGTPNTDYLYTGQQFDTATGLYSLRARYYDPGVGRFNNRDTWAYDFRNPMEFNRYVYAAGNPVNLVDPSGYDSIFTYVRSGINHAFRSAFSEPLRKSIGKGALGGGLGYLFGSGVVFAVQVIKARDAGLILNKSVIISLWNNTWTIADQLMSIIGGGLMGIAMHPQEILKRTPFNEFGDLVGKFPRNTLMSFIEESVAEWKTGNVLIGYFEAMIRVAAYISSVVTQELAGDLINGKSIDQNEALEGLAYNLLNFVPEALGWDAGDISRRTFGWWLFKTALPSATLTTIDGAV